MAPVLVAAGSRRGDHTYASHAAWTGALLFDDLGLDGLTLVCQDRGGLIGLRLVASHPERSWRVAAADTGLRGTSR